MICPECNEQKGCACVWIPIPDKFNENGEPYKVCPSCAEKLKIELLKNDPNTRVIQANTVPIRQRDQQESQGEEVRDQDVQSTP